MSRMDVICMNFVQYKIVFCHHHHPTVRNKIIYRRERHVRLQAAIRGWATRRDVLPRIRGLARIHGLYAQLEPMKAIIGQLKKDKDSAKKRHKALEKDMDECIAKIQVECDVVCGYV